MRTSIQSKFLSMLLCLASQLAVGEDAGFVPKPTAEDKNIGSTSIPKISWADKKLQTETLLLANTGGLRRWTKQADGTGTIEPVEMDAKTGALSISGKEVDGSVDANKPFLKETAWYLIQRYPDREFTTAYLKKYFDTTLPQKMSDEQKESLTRFDFSLPGNLAKNGDRNHGLSAGGLPFGRPQNAAAAEPTLAQLEAFYQNPTEWIDGTCFAEGICSIEHKPKNEAESTGSMIASKGIKALMLHEEDFEPAKPKTTTTTKGGEHSGGGLGKAVSSQAEFEADFAASPEKDAYVLFTADNCGPCQALHSDLAAGRKSVPAGTKLYVVSVPSYDWGSLSQEVRTFKGAGGFPQAIKFTKSADGKLSRSSFGPGGGTMGAFQ